MSYSIKNKNKGFTIIEVMIVLAIAGLILLIVFLAVPALQRNARNTQRKTDASAIASAVNEYIDNNNGSLPSAVSNGTNKVTLCSSSDTACSGSDAPATAKLGYYNSGSNTQVAINGTIPTGATETSSAAVYVITGAVCNGNYYSTTGATNNSYVVLYPVETSSSGYSWNCIT
jgi:prepilin-type N-terminal cleavage/methylation domain-containing protein